MRENVYALTDKQISIQQVIGDLLVYLPVTWRICEDGHEDGDGVDEVDDDDDDLPLLVMMMKMKNDSDDVDWLLVFIPI